MPWAAAAAVGSAVVGGIASNKAAGKAADAQRAAIEANAWQGRIAQDQWDQYKSLYQPLETQMLADVKKYDSPEARNAAAAEAQASVSSEIGKAQDRLSRTVGYDPSSAAAQAAQTNLALSGAAMGATAQNTARKQVKDTSYARQLDMLGLGKGLVTNASTGFANAASNANALAAGQMQMANAQGAAAGQLTGAVIGGLSKVDWSKFSSSPGNGMTSANMYSGGNDGWTLPSGESLGT
jgi:hypothetical protein